MGLKENILELWSEEESVQTIAKKLNMDENTIRVIFNRLVEAQEISDSGKRDGSHFKLYIHVAKTLRNRLRELIMQVEKYAVLKRISIPCFFTMNVGDKQIKISPSNGEYEIPPEIRDKFTWFAKVPPACGTIMEDGTQIFPGLVTIAIYEQDLVGWVIAGAGMSKIFMRKPQAYQDVIERISR